MIHLFKVTEGSFFKRRRIKKDLRKILEEEAFKPLPRKFRHPFTEFYRLEEIKAKIFSTLEERGYEPLTYKAVALELEGHSEDFLFKKTKERVNDYLNERIRRK